jgi:PilZ domain
MKHRPRELRRRVMLPARVRVGARWTDACILNVSSRGLMIRLGNGIAEGSLVEIRRGDQAIFARVVWRKGPQAGLQADDRVPIEDIMTLAQTSALQVTAEDPLGIERREQPRPLLQDSRQRARLMQFVGTIAIAVALAAFLTSMVEHALARPMALINAALGG